MFGKVRNTSVLLETTQMHVANHTLKLHRKMTKYHVLREPENLWCCQVLMYLSDCDEIQTHSNLVGKQTFKHLTKLAKWFDRAVKTNL